MKHSIKLVLLTGIIGVSSYAIADDASSSMSSSTNNSTNKTQMMKDCMAKQKAANSGMTHEAMKTTCKNQVYNKTQNGNDLATGPQAGTPQTKPQE
jgi:hypothetical protein